MIELNKIYCENNLDTMARMPDEFVDLTVTSPPYDNLRQYNGYTFDFEATARELFRVTKKGGVVVWVVGDATINGSETGTSFRQALYFKEIGFNLHDTMIWHKPNYIPLTHNRYEQSFEYMFALSVGKPSVFNPLRKSNAFGGQSVTGTFRHSAKGFLADKNTWQPIASESTRPNIWSHIVDNLTSREFNHPAIFPEALAKDHILSWSNEGDTVYDPFMGSGTTAKAAHQLKRNWIGSEISQEYVDLANKRLEPYLAQESLF